MTKIMRALFVLQEVFFFCIIAYVVLLMWAGGYAGSMYAPVLEELKMVFAILVFVMIGNIVNYSRLTEK